MSVSTSHPYEASRKIITKEKVASALLADKGRDASLSSYQVEDCDALAKGGASYVTRILVKYILAGKEQGTSYVAKLNNLSNESKNSAVHIMFSKEVEVLENLVPEMNSILGAKKEAPLSTSKCLYASLDNGDEIIIMEDLRLKGFRTAEDSDFGLDVDHVELILKGLARIHAASTLLNDCLQAEKLEEMKHLRSSFSKDDFPILYHSYSDVCKYLVENGATVAEVAGNYEKVALFLRKAAKNVYGILGGIAKSGSPPFNVLCHADLWVNNFLFRYDDSGKPVEFCLLDFQRSSFSSLSTDLNYLMYVNLSGKMRNENLKSFLSIYYEAFKSVIQSANMQMKFTEEELYDNFRQHNVYGWITASMEVPLGFTQPARDGDFNIFFDDDIEDSKDKMHQKLMYIVKTCPKVRPRLLETFDEMLQQNLLDEVDLSRFD